MLEAIFTVLCILVSGFYLYVLLQFRRESLRLRRKPNSLTYLGSNEGPTILFPAKQGERVQAGRIVGGENKLASVSRRPVARIRETATKATTYSGRLPYLEMTLLVTAVVTPVTMTADGPQMYIPKRQRA